jgi:hypothetical protein
MGSRDVELPDATKLDVRGARLYADDRPVDSVSYVVLEVYVTPFRGLLGSAGAPWREKLDEIEQAANATALDPYVTAQQRENAYRAALKGLREAQALLARDPMYTRAERKRIIERCCEELVTTLGIGKGKLAAPSGIDPELRELTGVGDASELRRNVAAYEKALEELRPELEARHGAE